MSVDLLIFGAGWTSTFLIPLCEGRGIKVAATSRSGRDATIPFTFEPESDDPSPYEALPDAKTVLITFPIQTSGASQRLVTGYKATRKARIDRLGFIQLGATSIWDSGSTKPSRFGSVGEVHASVSCAETNQFVEGGRSRNGPWCDRHSQYNTTPRAIGEDELLALSPETSTTVLNLAGLWGGQRHPRNWVGRVASTKEALRQKGSLHLINGVDVARAILAVHENFSLAQGQRWILTDGRVYDWWDLASAWGTRCLTFVEGKENQMYDQTQQRGPQPDWVKELMKEEGIRVLPRNIDLLGRALDSRDFWEVFGLFPVKALLEC